MAASRFIEGRGGQPAKAWAGILACRRALGIPLVAVLGIGLVACSPQRTIEAGLVLQDIAAGDGPSRLKDTTPTPRRAPVTYRVSGRDHGADLYLPGDAARAAIVLVPGVAEAGKNDRRLVALAKTLARARFAVLVPDIGGLRALKVRASDSREIADAVAYLASADGLAANGRVGIAAISYAVGPAVIAALEADVRDRVQFVLGIGGYHDIEAVIAFFTTGYYREQADGEWRYRTPNAYGKWIFVLSNLDLVRDAGDRAILESMARRVLKRYGPKVADFSAYLDVDATELASRLTVEGRAFHALLTNTDPEQVPDLIAALPDEVRANLDALNLAHKDLGRLKARLILVHGLDDDIIPFSESRALAAAVAREKVDLYLVDGLRHIGTDPGLFGKVKLLSAVYRLLEERDAAPEG